jgi:hypothetical protein
MRSPGKIRTGTAAIPEIIFVAGSNKPFCFLFQEMI